jgi:hypothetical protein
MDSLLILASTEPGLLRSHVGTHALFEEPQ